MRAEWPNEGVYVYSKYVNYQHNYLNAWDEWPIKIKLPPKFSARLCQQITSFTTTAGWHAMNSSPFWYLSVLIGSETKWKWIWMRHKKWSWQRTADATEMLEFISCWNRKVQKLKWNFTLSREVSKQWNRAFMHKWRKLVVKTFIICCWADGEHIMR